MKTSDYWLMMLFVGLLPFFSMHGQEILTENGFNRIYYPNGKISSEGFMRKHIIHPE
jgi:hypothetical protein